jgi:RNA polymerase sigma-70 factor (ECF subfamily)
MALFDKDKKSDTLKRLYFEHYTQLCQTVYRIVNNEDATKDIVQEVFIKYWKNLEKIHIQESEATYLKKACVNGALNLLKENERRRQRENSFAQETDLQTGERPDRQYIINETLDHVNNAIDMLPESCRRVFLLSRYEEKSYKEIGEMLNISVNTVEKHIGKALRVLRIAIRKE